ncbi:MAG: ferredoxin family protein [Candidatus Aminicenantes bacterium]|nr:ferredoxin family protein [Candidatus Aminicenantes bacterium]
MAKDETWHGIPRKDIPWFPTVDADACIGCSLCYMTCGRSVYEMRDNKAVPVKAMNCMVGCSTCGTVCPVQAIGFPGHDMIWKLEREHKIFKVVHQEAKEKKAKQDAAKARAAAEDAVAKLTTRVRFEVAGEFGDKRFLIQLEEMIKEKPVDFINVRMDVPTVQGARQKTPSFMSFDATSTEQEDIQDFLPAVRDLIRRNGLTLVSENKL